MARAAWPTVFALLLAVAQATTAQEAFLADDECLTETDLGCALSAVQFRSTRDLRDWSSVMSIDQGNSSNNTRSKVTPMVVHLSPASDEPNEPRDVAASANSSAASIPNAASSNKMASNVTVAAVNGFTATDSPAVNGSTVHDTPAVNGSTANVNGSTANDRPSIPRDAVVSATNPTEGAAASATSGDDTSSSSGAELPASVDENEFADNASSTESPDGPTTTTLAELPASVDENEGAMDSADNVSTTTVTMVTTTLAPKACANCALYDPSRHGQDWTPLPGQCYNLAGALMAIQNGSWCCEMDISPNMSAFPDECFVPPNHGGFPCFSLDQNPCY